MPLQSGPQWHAHCTTPCMLNPCLPASSGSDPMLSNLARHAAQLHDKVRQQIFKGELYEDRRAPSPAQNGSSSNSGSSTTTPSSPSASSNIASAASSSTGEAVENEWREHLVPAATADTQQVQHEAAAGSGSSSEGHSAPQGGAQALAGAMPHIHADAQSAGSSDSS